MIGMPGYPLSAAVILQELIAPLLEKWGYKLQKNPTISVTLAQRLASDGGMDDFLQPGRLTEIMLPFLSREEQVSRWLLLLLMPGCISRTIEGYSEGATVDALSLYEKPTIDDTILCTGFINPLIRVLDSMMRKRSGFIRFRNTGDVSGLSALSTRACHVTIIMYDPATDSSGTICREWLPDIPVRLLHCRYHLWDCGRSEICII